ncbi:hypothetical protein IWQ61_009766 [Dispira simplex]|nr:hypothetical protein IWQ61_009766 [Dispira simplex]
MVHKWASHESIEDVKRLHMDSRINFTMVLYELRPEFRRLGDLFLDLRDALFTWNDGSGAITCEVSKSEVEGTASPANQWTGHADPQGLASYLEDQHIFDMVDISHQLRMRYLEDMDNISTIESTIEMCDPLLERAEHEEAVTEKFFAVMFSEYNI